MGQPEGPRDDDPYRAVWHLSDVGGTADGKRHTELRLLPGAIAAFVVLLPFGILAGYLWAVGATAAGWVVTLVGLAGGFSMGAFIASDRS